MSRESTRKIEALWNGSKIGDQGAFAKALGVAQSLVSASLKGKKPSVAMWLKLGRFASEKGLHDQAIWFWQQAGLPLESILPVANYASKEQRGPAAEGEIVRVLPLPGIEENSEALPPAPFPAHMIPNPLETFYVRIADSFMSPVWEPGDILAVDRSETDIRKLAFHYVALFRPLDYVISETGDRRKTREQARAETRQLSDQVRLGEWPYERLGLLAGYLRRWGTSDHALQGFALEWYPSGLSRDVQVASANGRPERGLVVLGQV